MDLYYDEIKLEAEVLCDMLESFGNTNLSHCEKIALSDQLAEVAQMVRVKYGLTSAYYLQSEMNANKKIGKVLDCKSMAERMQIVSERDDAEYTAEWVNDGYGNARCSCCSERIGYVTNYNTYQISNFCPHCGKRIKK